MQEKNGRCDPSRCFCELLISERKLQKGGLLLTAMDDVAVPWLKLLRQVGLPISQLLYSTDTWRWWREIMGNNIGGFMIIYEDKIAVKLVL